MALAVRIVPVMLCRGETLVKGQRFVNDRVIGHVEQAARVHAAREVDELMIIDVAATSEGRMIDVEMISRITRHCFMPVTVGGGVRSIHDIRVLMMAGADKVLLGSAGDRRLEFVRGASSYFGSQAIVVSIDAGGRTGLPVGDGWYLSMADRLAEAGAGEILLNHVERDGTMEGYDIGLIAKFESVRVPLIACGGCSGYEDMRLAIKAGASAVAAGALFQFTDATPRGAAEYLNAHGVEVRCS